MGKHNINLKDQDMEHIKKVEKIYSYVSRSIQYQKTLIKEAKVREEYNCKYQK